MNILLISENPTIQKLFKLSAEKRGDNIEIGSKEYLPESSFDVVFIDKDFFSGEDVNNLKDIYENAKFILILNKNDEKLLGFDEYLIKPFLPTDLISLLDNLSSQNSEKSNNEFEDLDIENFDTDLNLDELDELDKDEDLDIEDIFVPDDNLEEEVEDEDLEEEIELNADELLREDELEEKAIENEVDIKEGIDEDIVINSEEIEELEEFKNSKREDNLSEELSENLDENVEELLNNEDLEEELNIKNGEEISNIEEMPNNDILENEVANLDEKNEEDEDIVINNVDLADIKDIENESEKELEINNLNEVEDKELDNIKNINLQEHKENESISETEENVEDLDELDELEKLDKKSLAEALGEKIEENRNEDKTAKEEIVHNSESSLENIQEKTLGNILNINWEELKKAKAKVTITIDFGG